MPQISVIIPAYNVEDYIDECIQSIINQTYKDFEIIIINDGSKDKTLDKVLTWSEENEEIKVINKENEGAGAARNDGLYAAKGKYVIFIDPDDVCHLKMLEMHYNSIVKFNSDISICDYNIMQSTEIIKREIRIPPNKKLTNETDKSILYKVNPHPWNKLFRKSLLLENHIVFPTRHRREDLFVVYTTLLMASSIVRVDKPLYNYRVLREGSATKSNSKTLTDVLKNLESLNEFYKKHDAFEKYFDELEMINANCAIGWYTIALANSNNKNVINIIKEYDSFFQKYFPNLKKNKYLLSEWDRILKVKTFFLFAPFGPKILHCLYHVKSKIRG